MAKGAGLTTPQHSPTHLDYEKECKTVFSPFVTDILDRAETAGWDRRQAAEQSCTSLRWK